MADSDKRLKETTNSGEQRRNPRFPNSRVWSEDQRRQHRDERDALLADAGLIIDRDLEADDAGKKDDTAG
ncbi:MAG TPA: hypothetical protein VLA56_07595 [Pseudomonadales bacterium]|nr:hypothetical protein [Pseudomonadales bacterium]